MEIPFVMEQVYDAPIQKVWQALTDENKMREWYFPQLEKFKPVIGFEFVFSNDGSRYQKEWQVTKIINGRLFAHSWIYKGYPGKSEVTFELCEERDKTRLKLTHTGLASFPDAPHFLRHRFEDGWNNILANKFKNFLSKDQSI